MAECHPDRKHDARGLCKNCASHIRYLNNKEHHAAHNKAYREKFPEKRLAADRAKRAKNPERYRLAHLAWRLKNREKFNAYHRKYYKMYRDRRQDAYYRKFYGITADQRKEMIAAQGGKCAICGEVPKRFHTDHDHLTGKVRGILCNSCNSLLGHARENVLILLSASRYLNLHFRSVA